MFEDTKALLESTAEERDNTKRALDCTRTVLHKTESDKQEQMFLVKVICIRQSGLIYYLDTPIKTPLSNVLFEYFFHFDGLRNGIVVVGIPARYYLACNWEARVQVPVEAEKSFK